MFLTTHNIEEANTLCDRVGIINRGILAAIDTPERLKQGVKETQSVEVAFDTAHRYGRYRTQRLGESGGKGGRQVALLHR